MKRMRRGRFFFIKKREQNEGERGFHKKKKKKQREEGTKKLEKGRSKILGVFDFDRLVRLKEDKKNI